MNNLVDQYLKELRLRLLDLSGRNRLLNFKFSERSRTQVRLVDKLPDQVFEMLEQGYTLTVAALPTPPNHPTDEDEDAFRLLLEAMRDADEEYMAAVASLDEVDHDSEESQRIERELRDKVREELRMPARTDVKSLSESAYAKHLGINPSYDLPTLQSGDGGKPAHRDKSLQTLLYPDELERKLAGLREGARKSIQETGLNTLYLAFGMLEWYESEQSDKRLLAPLLIYPVTLERQLRNGQYNYTVKSFGEGPEENFSLRERLRQNYGITLPAFTADDQQVSNNPEAYFKQISQIIRNHGRWTVRRFLTLSLFSFKGIALFQDLNPENWPSESSLLDHPLISTIFCGQEEVSQNAIADDYEVDEPKIARKVPLLITDADASQFSAIVDVLDDKNLVIKGPPGTGKSQTITNLIAAALAKGKKVLFLAEKKAALEVVYNRLAGAGLENYCLEVHSTATSRQSFYERLKQRVEQESPPDISQELEDQVRECSQLRQLLSRYVELLNQPCGKTGKTIQELLWSHQRAMELIANVPSVPSGLESFRDDKAAVMTTADLQRKCQHLREFQQQQQELLQKHSQIRKHPWFGLTAHNLSPIDQGDLRANAEMWSNALKQLHSTWHQVVRILGLEQKATLTEIQKVQQRLGNCPRIHPLIEGALLPVLKTNKKNSSVILLTHQVKDLIRNKQVLMQFFQEGLDSSELSRFKFLLGEPQNSEEDIEHIHNAVQALRTQVPELCNSSHASLLIKAKETSDSLKASRTELSRSYNLYACKGSGQMSHYAKQLRQSNLLSSLFNSKYREAKDLWKKIQKQSSHCSDSEIAGIFEKIARFQEQLDRFKCDAKLKRVCGKFFKGLETDFQGLLTINSFASELIQRIEELEATQQKINLSEAIYTLGRFYQEDLTDIDRLEATTNFAKSVIQSQLPKSIQDKIFTADAALVVKEIHDASHSLSEFLENEARYRQAFFQLGQPDVQVMFGSQNITDIRIEKIAERVDRAVAASSDLPTWINYHRVYQQVADDGIQSLVEAFERENLALDNLEDVYQAVFYRSLLRFAYQKHPELSRLSGIDQAQARKQFQQSDKKLLRLYQKQLVAQLAQVTIEPGNSRGRKSELTNLALIQNEINKQKRHIPQRELFQRASVALQQLKPCWMMSPASVAQFIPPGAVTFDLVIIDEASQMRPEEAIGSIARAKQLVVVGDPKQLPPTDFFRSNFEQTVDEDIEQEVDVLDNESILDMSLKVFYPIRQLKWHYRSRHQSLIDFSNCHFYDGKLTIFPSPNKKFAVEYQYIKTGAYRSGANVPEAMRVAEATADFMRQYPNLSLGVVTLNQKQQELLLDEMDRLFALYPELEQYRTARESTLEPFFVKNLENVQGDERDVIFISTVYGPERPGMPVMQRFGPINLQNGHRRLNVLFTRAKERVVVFSSMQASDIRPSATSKDGVHILKAYLDYAQTQRLIRKQPIVTNREPDSDFEVFVAERLRQHGYEVVPQIGVSGYFIDLAVVDPRQPGTYLLGVECDGATYHSSKAARDRDRLRQQVLEQLGWKIYRIWSTDWFTDSKVETEKLIAHIQTLIT
ncbi:DUF4011 domain-containing protein [Leptolyngbya sp. CCY15150]|uniref:DUF4011 domain-containing protein n=1 Tax=Leptolyngbya sp. CCY15150 TaxID=2767772 RepID=UPI0019510624|nr:DUF4011 domain-containing protein [Leptolyngbya sp. CCY15150]